MMNVKNMKVFNPILEVLKESSKALSGKELHAELIRKFGAESFTHSSVQAAAHSMRKEKYIGAVSVQREDSVARMAKFFFPKKKETQLDGLDHRPYKENTLHRRKQQQREASIKEPDILVSIPGSGNETVTISISQAKALYKQLDGLFGNR